LANGIEVKVETKIEVKVQDNKNESPPSSNYNTKNVICLKDKLVRDTSDYNRLIHKISGIISWGLNLIKVNPKNSSV